MQRLYRRYYSRGLRVIGITEMDPTRDQIRKFISDNGLTYPIVLDPKDRTGARYRLQAHPTSVLVDGKGIVRYVHEGFLKGDERAIEAAILRVLGPAGGRGPR